MTEPFRSLLDAAVEDVRPRVAEPAAELIRRGRAARRRRVAAASIASAVVVAIAAGGVVGLGAAKKPSGVAAPGTPTASAQSGKALAREAPKVVAELSEREVRIGNLILPIPLGWQVIRDQRMYFCDIPAKAILINVMQIPDQRNCDLVPQIAISSWELSPGTVGRGLNEVVLPGGAPLWLSDNDLQNVGATWNRDVATVAGAVPWTGAHIRFDMPPAQLDFILRWVRSSEVNGSPLTLPNGVHKVRLDMAAATHPNVDPSESFSSAWDATGLTSTAPEMVLAVLGRLAALDRPVAPGELPCADAQPLVASLPLAGSHMAQLTLFDAEDRGLASIALSGGGGCAFATSSLGGRVWLPDGFAAGLNVLMRSGE